jgi:hypothetical protein
MGLEGQENGSVTPAPQPQDLAAAAKQFAVRGRVVDIERWGNGLVHDTFRVTVDAEGDRRFILQRLNMQVFCHPEQVMSNIRTVTEHMGRRLQDCGAFPGRRWEVVRVLLTGDGRDHWIGSKGSFWRALSFVDSAFCFDSIPDLDVAGEMGYALGRFHSLIGDLPATRLLDTLAGFHITPRYLQHHDAVLARCGVTESPEIRYGLRFVQERRARAGVLEEAKAQGKLVLRPIHGDPKVNNILVDGRTRKAVAMIDLDTVKPGLLHYDIGDCLRSGCNPMGEETPAWETVYFEAELFQAILGGYLNVAGEWLTEYDREYLFEAVHLISFELGLRFLTDFLAGNVYFRVRNPEHNLIRALVQFKLTESIESQEGAIRGVLKGLQ